MADTVTVAIISLFGTLLGSLGGIIASGKLTSFRLENLEKKVDELGKAAMNFPIIEKEQQNFALRLQTLEKRTENIMFPA